MAELPTGTVTFLFTDIEGSTRLWQADEVAMRTALSRHDELLRKTVAEYDGVAFSSMGDGIAAAFESTSSAVAAALGAQRLLGSEVWPAATPLRVRMGLHTGEAQLRDGDYLGTTVNRAARLMAIAHGGQVVVSGATEQVVRGALPEGIGLIDLGQHRLRDLSEPIAIFQMRHPDLRGSFPPLRSLDAFPANLPIQLSSFVGREREVAEVVEVLDKRRLVTLTGVGGVGKTRLALQVAAEVLPRFSDGAWLCELASVRDPAEVVDAVASVFQVTAHPGMGLEDSLVAYLGHQEMLLVLDNCEHVLRPVAALVRAIEAACPKVRVLATSREGLGIRGEQNLTVPSLEVPDDASSLESVEACEAVRLFVDRAQGVKAGFAVDAVNAAGVAQVCRRLDGVPLAIELAAARIPTMNPTELARRLDRRFRLLTGGDRDAIERHQTLRATIDWSYDLLSVSEQRLLAHLSVFAGGCTLESAEAVCAGELIEADEVLDLLATLVARSLVVVDDTSLDTRYRLLETIRQYGEERLAEAGETDTLRARHADYYIEFAGIVYWEILGPDQKEWGARLASEHDNLLAAMAFALGTQDVDRAMGLLWAMPLVGAQLDNPVVFDPAAVLALPGATEHPGSARALMDSAYRAVASGDYGLALELIEQARETEQRLGPADPLGSGIEMYGSLLRAGVAMASGSLAEAAEWYLDVAERHRAAGQDGLEASCLGSSAYCLAWVDPEAAIARATGGLTLARRSGMPSANASNLRALAVAVAPSDPRRAAALLTEADTVAPGHEIDLSWALFATTLLADWPSALRATKRLLDRDRRSGSTPLVILSASFNVVARALTDSDPEAAAVLQGTVRGLAGRPSPGGATPTPRVGATELNALIELFIKVRRDTTAMLVDALGEPRLRELRAQGEAMDRDQASAYARTHIAEYLAATAPEVDLS